MTKYAVFYYDRFNARQIIGYVNSEDEAIELQDRFYRFNGRFDLIIMWEIVSDEV